MVEDKEDRESNWDFTMAMLGIHNKGINFLPGIHNNVINCCSLSTSLHSESHRCPWQEHLGKETVLERTATAISLLVDIDMVSLYMVYCENWNCRLTPSGIRRKGSLLGNLLSGSSILVFPLCLWPQEI